MAILRTTFPAVHAAIKKLYDGDEELASEGGGADRHAPGSAAGELVRRPGSGAGQG